MITVQFTPEQLGFLRGLLESVKAEHVPAKPTIFEKAFGNGIDSILAALP